MAYDNSTRPRYVKRTIRLSDGHIHFMRWDRVVHIVDTIGATAVPVFDVTASGHVVGNSFPVTAQCGRKAKMGFGGHNRFTNAPPTCLQCIGE